jgi:DNA-binding response OmpR family regulator
MFSILVAEDDKNLNRMICAKLKQEQYNVFSAFDGQSALDIMEREHIDLIISDVMMPRMDGFEMVRQIRQSDKHTPVLFLTARSAINDVVQGFELGANDYLKKPFGMQELIVRIKSLAGRLMPSTEDNAKHHAWLEIGQYRFNPTLQRLQIADMDIELSYRESEILRRLCENRNQVVNTQNILLELWGDDSFFNTKSLHVFITKLRHKLSKDPMIRLVNVRGIGYKLID